MVDSRPILLPGAEQRCGHMCLREKVLVQLRSMTWTWCRHVTWLGNRGICREDEDEEGGLYGRKPVYVYHTLEEEMTLNPNGRVVSASFRSQGFGGLIAGSS